MWKTLDLPVTGRFRDRWLLPRGVDVALAAGFVLLSLGEGLFVPTVRSPLLHIAVTCSAMALLAWRRRFPVAVAAVVMAATILIDPKGEFSTLLALVLVSFTVGVETSPPRSYGGLAVVLIPFLAAMSVDGPEPSDFAAALVFLVGPWSVGGVFRERGVLTKQALDRAAKLEAEREAATAAAAERERNRIARELHDIVSHSISVVAIQAQAVRRRLGPAQVQEAEDLAALEATAREALAEMRRLFGVLRREGEKASLAPQPGLAELDRLVHMVGVSDLQVEVTRHGDVVALSPGVDLAAYRIIQESLTNALRHSGADRAHVSLQYSQRDLSVTVEDNGRGMAERSEGGLGLVGVRERVALYGGTVALSTGSLGGLRLVATLPIGENE